MEAQTVEARTAEALVMGSQLLAHPKEVLGKTQMLHPLLAVPEAQLEVQVTVVVETHPGPKAPVLDQAAQIPMETSMVVTETTLGHRSLVLRTVAARARVPLTQPRTALVRPS